MEKKNKIAILYICTGEYVAFWKMFYYSFKRLFLKNSEIHYFVFTDSSAIEYIGEYNVHIIPTEKKQWPYGTLMRYHLFLQIEEELEKFDYCFFMNANMVCMQEINENILPQKEDLVVVRHPGTYSTRLEDIQFERNPKSTAYVEKGKERIYVCGGVNGGKAKAFIDMAKEISRRIDVDLKNNIIAIWHDESHLNRYILDYSNYKLLDSEYCYPEGWTLPVEQKLIVRVKERTFNVNLFKTGQRAENINVNYENVRRGDRWRQYFEVTRQLLFCKDKGKFFRDYLMEKNLHTIAIYGYRNMGEILLDEICDSGINVKYIIDNNINIINEGLKTIKGTDIENISGVDGIIVAALFDYYSIYDAIVERVHCPVYSMDFLVHDMYMECIDK